MSTHNFVVEKLREILANLENSPRHFSTKNGTSSSISNGVRNLIRTSSTVATSLSQDTFPSPWGSDSAEVGQEGVTQLRSDWITGSPNPSSAIVNGSRSRDVVFGEASLFPSRQQELDQTRESTSTIFGIEITADGTSSTQRFHPHRKGIMFPMSDPSDTNSLMKNLQELIQVLKMSSPSSKSSNSLLPDEAVDTGGFVGSKDMELNLTLDIADLNNLMSDYTENSMPFKHIFIIFCYLLIACISIIGNLLVVQLVIRSRRLHTLTHALLANLAVADLFMATLNIPFSAARVILAEWPFGSFLCQVVPFVQVTSVYVTSITMAVIAVDRYQVIINPLGRRMKNSQGILLVIAIWSLAAFLSLPFALHHKVVTVLTVRVVRRCQAEFSSMERRRWLTVATVFGQYFIPLIFTTVSYVFIMMRLGLRSSAMGSTTPRQVAAQSKAKRKTIKMLVLTVIFFAACWAPINAYHLLTHFSLMSHNSTVILTCHLIAMSSTCYNPFIYCWLNEHFRQEALKWMRCFRSPRSSFIHPGMDTNGVLTRSEVLVRQHPTNQYSTLIQLLNYRSHRPRHNSPTIPSPEAGSLHGSATPVQSENTPEPKFRGSCGRLAISSQSGSNSATNLNSEEVVCFKETCSKAGLIQMKQIHCDTTGRTCSSLHSPSSACMESSYFCSHQEDESSDIHCDLCRDNYTSDYLDNSPCKKQFSNQPNTEECQSQV